MIGYRNTAQLKYLETDDQLFATVFQRWSLVAWSLSIVIQVCATSLIAWKVWFARMSATGLHKNQRSVSILWMVLESGAVLTLSHVVLVALFAQGTIASGIVYAMIGQLDVRVILCRFMPAHGVLQTLIPTSMLVRVASSSIFQSGATISSSPARSWRNIVPQRRDGTDPSLSSLSKPEDHELYNVGKVRLDRCFFPLHRCLI